VQPLVAPWNVTNIPSGTDPGKGSMVGVGTTVAVAVGGMGEEVEVGVIVEVLVTAAEARSAAVASCSSGDGPQDDKKIPNNINTNPGLNFLVNNIIDLLLVMKWIIRNK
jgi:hypothetical protein